MAATLKSLAGSAFYDRDVLVRFYEPIAPEHAVLDRYVFLPHARSGIAAALSTPFAWGGPARATVEMAVPVVDDRGPLNAQMTVHVFGPGDVAELATRQVIRTWPKADAPHAEIDDLVQIEFDRPELPWLFTPAGPANGRLVPWLTLVVAQRGAYEWKANRGSLRVAGIRRDQLQPLHDAWAWAHAQVMGQKLADPAAEPTLERRLSGVNAEHNLSRLICPRRLAATTAYTAFVVPTFTAGVHAALGLSPVATLEPAWGTAADFTGGEPTALVEVPVFYTWDFATGQAGNFESLARKIFPRVAPPGVGRRRVDATRPWPGTELAADDPGAEIVVQAPVVSPQDPEDYPEEQWPSEADQQWAPDVAAELVEKINRPHAQAHQENPGPPLVGPPLYGANHVRQPVLETEPGPVAGQPPWFRELNRDPRDRIVGGLGTRVVQHDQESLMASAWNQVIGVEEANRRLRMAQLAKHVAASLHARHLARFGDAALLKATERVHAKVFDGPGTTVWSSLSASSLPPAATTGTYRRMLRTRGPIVRAAELASQADLGPVAESLTVRADRLTTDWVIQYAVPDGIAGLGDAAVRLITPELVDQVAPGADPAEFVEQLQRQLREPGVESVLTHDAVDQLDLPPDAELATNAVRTVLARTPSPESWQRSPNRAASAAACAAHLGALVRAGHAADVSRYPVPEAMVRRLDLPADRDERGYVVHAEALSAWAEQLLAQASEYAELSVEEFQADAANLQERLLGLMSHSREYAARSLHLAVDELVVDDVFAEPARGRVPVPDLQLVDRLDPRIVIPARVTARLSGGTGRFPQWLRADWFANLRIEPAMACPRFDWPMYEALDRYDRNWLIPGLGLIKRPDMATLLETNNRFVEAFLVGLNHEMGRELLWREYPTDQRGTYFRSFWTGDPELVAELHEAPWLTGGLRTHVDPALDGRIVLLVRGELIQRYPGVVAHAVRQAQQADGTLLDDDGVPLFEPGSLTSPTKTLFRIHLAPNILLVGFALSEEDVKSGAATWWFTLSENPSEPRFGLDVSRTNSPPPAPAPSRDDLVWDDFGTPIGGFLDAAAPLAIAFPDDATAEVSQWGHSSAEVAMLLFQLPARAAYKGTRMLDAAVD